MCRVWGGGCLLPTASPRHGGDSMFKSMKGSEPPILIEREIWETIVYETNKKTLVH